MAILALLWRRQSVSICGVRNSFRHSSEESSGDKGAGTLRNSLRRAARVARQINFYRRTLAELAVERLM
jgi:hypothetical protein